MNYNVVAHTNVEQRSKNRGLITIKLLAAGDEKIPLPVADVEIMLYAPVVNEPGKFVIEELTKIFTQIGAMGRKVERVDPSALRHLGIVKP